MKNDVLNESSLLCQYCERCCKNLNSLRQHETRCKSNPNGKFFNNFKNRKHPWNKGLTKETSDIVKCQAESQSRTKRGKPGHKHTEEEKQNLREHALKNNLGGFNMRKKTIFVNGIAVDSSYEKIVAENLTENEVEWKRCSKIKYIDNNGKIHYYTPDFYLTKFNVYLDPKNDFLINNINPRLGFKDVDKIEWVMRQNKIKIIILDKDNLTFEKIMLLIEETK